MQSSEDVQVCPTASCARHVPGTLDRSQYAPATQLQSQAEPIGCGGAEEDVHLLWQHVPSVRHGSAEQLPLTHSDFVTHAAPSAMVPWSTGAHWSSMSAWPAAVWEHGMDDIEVRHEAMFSG
jgi:hypothetical protein